MRPISTKNCSILPARNERPDPKFQEQRKKLKKQARLGKRDLERRVRTRKGFLATTPAKRERAGPSAMSAYPSPAATVISLLSRHGLRSPPAGGGTGLVLGGRGMLCSRLRAVSVKVN
jgi:hypothetical protein